MGSLILAGFLAMMRWMHGFKSDGTIDYTNAIGNIGNVYVPIQPTSKVKAFRNDSIEPGIIGIGTESLS